jgi:aryl-alcohol dehydrogenase (NADP+)
MEYRKLENTDLEVSAICFGAWAAGGWMWGGTERNDAIKAIRAAHELGVTSIDTAPIYGQGNSEEIVGEAIKGLPRDKVQILTKYGMRWDLAKGNFDFKSADTKGNQIDIYRYAGKESVIKECEDSLRRLGTDYIDLYQIHRLDKNTPLEETLEALHDVVKAGKVRYIGASSMYAWQFSKALYTSRLNGWTEFVSMQNHVNLLNREEEREMLPLCADQKIAVMPWSPLARGRLTRAWDQTSERQQSDEFGKTLYVQSEESDRKIVEQVAAVAKARGVPQAQVAMAWLLQKKGITSPIIGASKPAHLTDAVAALLLKLTSEEVASLEALYVPHAVAGFG